MSFKFKKKKAVIIIVVFVLFLIAGGVFLLLEWLDFKKAQGPDLSYENEYVKAEDFKIVENSEGKFVKCEKYSLRVKVPDEWTVKIFDGEVDLNDSNIDEENLLESARQGACGMGIEIYENKKNSSESETYADYLRIMINSLEDEGTREDSRSKEEIVLISEHKGFKKTLFREGKASFINIEVPIGQVVYNFTTGFIGAEKCVDAFDEIMKTVEISK